MRAWLALLWVGWLVGGWLSVAHALPPDTWVVAIGNNYGDADEIGLHYAEDDARSIVKVLHELGGVPSDRIVFLAGEKAPAIRRTLAQIKARIAGGGAGAFVVYYSGHSDANALHLDGSRLALEELVSAVESAGAKTRMVILDACRSGGASRVKGMRTAQSFELSFIQEAQVEGLAVITSSTALEASLESDRLGGSFFTHFFVAGLRGAADEDGDGQVTLNEVYNHAYNETVRASGRTEQLQHPTFAVDMKGKGAVVLSRLNTKSARLGRLVLPERSLYLIQDAKSGRLVAEVKPNRPDAHVVVPARAYAIQQRGTREYREYDVHLGPGQTVSLVGQPYRSIRYDRLVRRRGGDKLYVHGFSLLGGIRGEVLRDDGLLPSLSLGYGLDLPWLSLGVRVRGAQTDGVGGLTRRRHEVGAALTVERFTDLSWISVSFGLLVEAMYLRQTFASDHQSPTSIGYGANFAGLLSLERHLFGGISLRLEGGPTTVVMPVTQVADGQPVGDEVESTLTWSSNLGLVWRL